ncbi:hypothetical protein CQW23_31098 [Capsicum baccatum]|uniref:FRIGIDA-like protein n=1 Tax=Capsicum baccatum TaxID=33114 RepID=A0A2G2V8J4_CAPBA|nr:hypothetical protein CQW23_31098 [Capsicum baccatum]
MAEPTDSAIATTAAPPQSPPSPAAVQVEAHQQQNEQQTVNAAASHIIIQQSELQQPPNESIADFRKLSDAFSAFQNCFAELQKHVCSIQTLIDSMRPSLPAAAATATTAAPEVETSSESDPSEEVEAEDVEVVKTPKSPCSALKSTISEVESLCEKMDGRGLRKYMIVHIEDINGLVEQVSKALKLSPNPGRLVLDCLGKFYLQGSKAYVKGSPVINGRKASILALECFLVMGVDEGVEIEKEVKEEAGKAAFLWRKRLIAEGGLRKAHDMDARGLLLLIGCFGIPRGFSNVDIRDLLLASPFKKNMNGALTRSNAFMKKIPEIIEEMVNEKLVIEAVDIAYTFGIEDRFNPQKLVISFLRKSKEPLIKKMKGKSQGSLADMNDAKKQHLAALRSVTKCLRRHGIKLSELLPGWKINEKIMSLEKEIAEGETKMAQKRKIDETESSGRISNNEAKRSHFPNQRLQQERVVNLIDSNSTLLEGGTAGHMYVYSLSPSVLHRPVGSSMHDNVGSLAGIVRGVSAGTDVVPQAGSYAGGHRRMLVDSTPGCTGSHVGQLYGLHGDVAVHDGLLSHSYAYGPSSYLEGSRGLPNTIPTDVAGRSSASDPYQLDDSVRASELYRSGGLRAADAVPSVASAHLSSHLYWP